jgi:acetyl esterase/lipase
MAVQAAPPDAGKLSLWSGQAPVGDGVTGIVLEYRLPRGRSFVPLLDAQRAIRTVRFNAKQWSINPARIGIIGFSAGGHLASTAGTHFDGGDPKPEMVNLFSNEKQVTGKTPPMFLAHAKDDTLVVPDNSRMLYEALKAHKLAAEYLELPSGGHGLNGYKGPMWDAWQSKSLEWLAAQKIVPAGGSSGAARAGN